MSCCDQKLVWWLKWAMTYRVRVPPPTVACDAPPRAPGAQRQLLVLRVRVLRLLGRVAARRSGSDLARDCGDGARGCVRGGARRSSCCALDGILYVWKGWGVRDERGEVWHYTHVRS